MFLGPYLEAGLYQFSVTLKTVHGRGTMSSKHPPAWPASALSHASWQASHLLTTVCNAYLLFSHRPRDFHFTSSHSYERSTSETSLGRPLYTSPSQLGQSYPTIHTT